MGAVMAKRLPNKALIEVKKIKVSNDAYYKALSARDMRAMEKVWTCAANNMLIAPPENPRVYVGWSVAWVHGIETLHRRTRSGEVSSSHNYGTNIFVHRNDRWLMVFHQVVAIPEKHVSKRVV